MSRNFFTAKSIAFAFSSTLLASLLAQRYFAAHETMATCALLALGLASFSQEILEYNRRAIWGQELSPALANRKLALEFAGIFVGIFSARVFWLNLHPLANTLLPDNSFQNSLPTLLLHNLQVLGVGIVLALLYQASGLILILGWNALGWATSIVAAVSATSNLLGLWHGALLALGLLPHLVLEVISYVLGGMSGVFLSKAFLKYPLRSAEFRRVAIACASLFGLAILALTASALLEVTLGQSVFQRLNGK